MRIPGLIPIALLLLAATPALALQEGAERTLELRVTARGAGRTVLVDRGTADGLAVGDLVRFLPRGGGVWGGRVAELAERTGVVELDDPQLLPEPGTRGEARLPETRFARTSGDQEPPAAAPQASVPEDEPGAEPEGGDVPPEHPPWERDDDWTAGQPLLARVDTLRPAQREPTLSGRVYVIADQLFATQDDRSDTFARMGTDLRYGNPFGRGGELHLDGEWNLRETNVPGPDESETKLRVDRASYSWGGSRYEPVRHEIGRFLQQGMPEFGVLDGYEWSGRAADGTRMGYSVGFLPEPTPDMNSGHDLQFAAFYRWVADETERVSSSVGFQKTLHNGAADRDLLIAKFQVLPDTGWSWHGNAWVDYYTAGDEAKGPGVDLTQAYLSTSRRWADDRRVDVSYTHLAFPDIQRYEFLQLTPQALEKDRADRVALEASEPFGRRRVHGGVGGWSDEEEAGADGQLGLEFPDWILDESRTDLTLFGAHGRFSNLYGGRVGFGWQTAAGSWDVMLELALARQQGFNSNNDDLLQQRYRVVRQLHTRSGWDFAAHAEGTILESEEGFGLGFYLQRSF